MMGAVTVPGVGPAPARMMIVGEAPGPTEVKRGEPFVGPSGHLLNKALAVLGVDRQTVYVTNTVKFMPTDASGRIRPPSREEVHAWRPQLEGELEEVMPAAVLALGGTAAEALTGEARYGRRFGVVYAAWHPAYCLHRYGGRPVPAWLEQLAPWALTAP